MRSTYLRALDTVDPDNIGLEGHSMGGWAVLAAAAAQPDGYKAMVLEGSAPGSFGAPQGTQTFPRNLAVVFSAYDEFSDLMWGVPTGADVVRSPKLKEIFGTLEPVVPGKLYGYLEYDSARMLHVPPVTHPGDHLSTAAIGAAVDWFALTLHGGTPQPAHHQIWYWKELTTLVALVGMIITIIGLGLTMLQWRAAKFLIVPLPATPRLVAAGHQRRADGGGAGADVFPAVQRRAGVLAGIEPGAAATDERPDAVGHREHDDRDRGHRHSRARLRHARIGRIVAQRIPHGPVARRGGRRASRSSASRMACCARSTRRFWSTSVSG